MPKGSNMTDLEMRFSFAMSTLWLISLVGQMSSIKVWKALPMLVSLVANISLISIMKNYNLKNFYKEFFKTQPYSAQLSI